jgi:hypothetical protein
MDENTEQSISSEQIGLEINNINVGAFLITPIWCFANGFWLSALACIIAYSFFWPLGILISLLFLFKGNEWSWKNGDRWDSLEEFNESQFMMTFVGLIISATALVIKFL